MNTENTWRFVYKLKGEETEHVETHNYGDWDAKALKGIKTDEECEAKFEYWYFTDIRFGRHGVFSSFPNPLPEDLEIIVK